MNFIYCSDECDSSVCYCYYQITNLSFCFMLQ